MCAQLTKDSLEEGGGRDILQKVEKCGEKLMSWGKELTSNFGRRIKECKTNLKFLRNKRDIRSQEEFNAERRKLNLILSQRKIFWHQHSKQLWLHSGD